MVTKLLEDRTTVRSDQKDEFFHLVLKIEHAKAFLNNTTPKTLCGKKWLPPKDFSKLPLCPDCKNVWNLMVT